MGNAIHIQNEMNRMGEKGLPFVFLIDFSMVRPLIFPFPGPAEQIIWQTPRFGTPEPPPRKPVLHTWKIHPVSLSAYRKGFDIVQRHILNGDTYLLNYTCPTPVETNLIPEEIFYLSKAPYKVLLKNRFVCFSPEPFITIDDGKISSFPMKGTIGADENGAEQQLLTNTKEMAEHHTIVDLIRNDLSKIAETVKVEKFRYPERIHTNRQDLWQISSKITGDLAPGYPSRIGDIVFSMLPAGSVSGAPKQKTVEIILQAENYERGYYTGVFGVFDGKNMDSCVLIRFLENQNGQLIYKSGGGITFMSRCEDEYQEMINKIYVPVD